LVTGVVVVVMFELARLVVEVLVLLSVVVVLMLILGINWDRVALVV